jgi:hypothetical protein
MLSYKKGKTTDFYCLRVMKEKPGIREKNPGSATLPKSMYFFFNLYFLFVFGPKIMCHPDPKTLSSQAWAIVKTTTSPPL